MALVNNPSNIKGTGTSSGTKRSSTPTTSSSAKIFPNKRKQSDRGFVKSSKTLIGNKKGAGST